MSPSWKSRMCRIGSSAISEGGRGVAAGRLGPVCRPSTHVNEKEGDRMARWTNGELLQIAEADDLHISPLREDGKTYGTPTWIWSVAVDDGLYVRAYNGSNSSWYQAALRQKAG